MAEICNFPIQMTREDLDEVAAAARLQGYSSTKAFMLAAINEKKERGVEDEIQKQEEE